MTRSGRRFFATHGIDLDALERGRRPLCRPCLDWSERRSHLGGALGGAVLDWVVAQGWAVREARTRVVRFSAAGERKMRAWISADRLGPCDEEFAVTIPADFEHTLQRPMTRARSGREALFYLGRVRCLLTAESHNSYLKLR